MKYFIGNKEYSREEIKTLATEHAKAGIDSGATVLAKQWENTKAKKTSKEKKETV